MNRKTEHIAVLGGTGHLGHALARRWARAGHRVIIGSRVAERADEAAGLLAASLGRPVDGDTNRGAAERADVVVVTVPFESQSAVLQEVREAVAGKLVIDTTVPLMPPRVTRVRLPAEGSAAQRAQALLGDAVTLVSAFHNVAAHKLATDAVVDCDVLVFGNDKSARQRVVLLVEDAGLRGVHGGVLANSAAAEALTSVLIFVNGAYGADGAGIRISGNLPSAPLRQ